MLDREYMPEVHCLLHNLAAIEYPHHDYMPKRLISQVFLIRRLQDSGSSCTDDGKPYHQVFCLFLYRG